MPSHQSSDQTVTGEELIARARALIPQLRERATRAERERRVPAETIADMQEAGLFRVLQPKRWGGYQLDPQVFFEVQMALAEGCMSTAWIYGVIAVHNWQLALFDERAQNEVWEKDSATLISSSYMPKGKIERVDGGFKLSGRWGFSSGVDHCDWAFLGVLVPPAKPGGAPEYRTFLVPRGDFRTDDVWHTVGLKGTGSQDVVVEGAFVPDYRTHKAADGFAGTSPGLALNDAPLYQLPFGQIFVRAVSTATIGALQGALTSFLEASSGRVSVNDGSRTAEDPTAQQLAAEASLAIDEMRTMLLRNFASMMASLCAGEPLKLLDRIHYRVQSASVVDRCAQLVSRLFYSSGAHGIYLGSPLSRYFVDIHCARTHVANNVDKYSRNYGGVLLGRDNTDFFL
ncbi:acyl-CoA dehydrogenase family protein [Neisseriaceae bacterium JH1-16]|nr:acyl-CoA dehydrogenase family protein [Neisseriaceae bacterium JH1-16]